MRRAAFPILLLALVGCGGSNTLTAEQLEKQVETIDSVAGEGSLLAGDVERGRTTEPFARIHSGDLSELADSTVEALDKLAPPGAEDARRREEARAQAVAEALAKLHSDPADQRVAAQVRRDLERLAG